MEDIEDDTKEFVVGLEGAGDTPQTYIRVRDDALIEEIQTLGLAVKVILERLESI